MTKWTKEYDNDAGPYDDYFEEWWNVTDGSHTYRCNNSDDADFLIAALAQPEQEPIVTLDYLQGHQDGLDWAADLAVYDDPRTGDWMYDDRYDLASAIRKGPEMPIAQPEQEQLELPEPRLTGKFSITAGKFMCTGCTGTWTNRVYAKHHSCRDYQ